MKFGNFVYSAKFIVVGTVVEKTISRSVSCEIGKSKKFREFDMKSVVKSRSKVVVKDPARSSELLSWC